MLIYIFNKSIVQSFKKYFKGGFNGVRHKWQIYT
jgi:hypothetical protein